MSLADILPADFFASHWRRSPLVLRGSAHRLLPEAAGDVSAVRQLIRSHPDAKGDERSIWFVEGVRRSPDWAQALCADMSDFFEWDDVWIDLFATVGVSSIGRHFDDSDNFTCQLGGTKTWSLRSALSVPADMRRRRALGDPGVGSLWGNDEGEGLQVELRAGDILYIPSMWAHEGVSKNDSTSVSLVVNSATVLHGLLPQLEDRLRHDAKWSEMLSVGPGSTEARERQLSRALSPDVVSDVWSKLSDSGPASLKASFSPRRASASAALDLAWLRDYVGEPVDVSGEGSSLLAETEAGAVRKLVARRNAKRLARMLLVCSSQTGERRARDLYSAAARSVSALEPLQADDVLTTPEICVWLEHVARRRKGAYPMLSAEDPDVDLLAVALLPELAMGHSGRTLAIAPPLDLDGGWTIGRLGVRMLSPFAAETRVEVEAGGRLTAAGASRRSLVDVDFTAGDFGSIHALEGRPGIRVHPALPSWAALALTGTLAPHAAEADDAVTRKAHRALEIARWAYPESASMAAAYLRSVFPGTPSSGLSATVGEKLYGGALLRSGTSEALVVEQLLRDVWTGHLYALSTTVGLWRPGDESDRPEPAENRRLIDRVAACHAVVFWSGLRELDDSESPATSRAFVESPSRLRDEIGSMEHDKRLSVTGGALVREALAALDRVEAAGR